MSGNSWQSAFKAYDIRGKVPSELNAGFAHDLGLALVAEFAPDRVVIGRDVRHSGPELQDAISRAFVLGGVDVCDLGVCGTEEIYFAAARKGFDLGVMLTASHNPAEYNGIKLVRAGALPISGDSGLDALKGRILRKDFKTKGTGKKGVLRQDSFREEYVGFLLNSVSLSGANPLKIVMNPGNGCAGPVLRDLLPALPGDFVMIQEEPDGDFPNGIPNPLLPEKRADTANAVLANSADLGLAWDGDFDRCFFFDSRGIFIESYYLLGLLAQNILKKHPGGKILHDTRLIWNTIELVRKAGGIPVQGKTGHSFMKESMRRENALYGGEMSAHHYFREFSFCDSGMLPWLRLLEILEQSGRSLAELVDGRMRAYPCSGEINARVHDAPAAIKAAHKHFSPYIIAENYIDGLSADCGEWRFNLRSSNTEPLLRLNVESRGNPDLMREKTSEILDLLSGFADSEA